MVLNIITLVAVAYSIYATQKNSKQINNLVKPSNGAKGDTGFQGATGSQGYGGFQGATGSGFQGAQGAKGFTGDVDYKAISQEIKEELNAHLRQYHSNKV